MTKLTLIMMILINFLMACSSIEIAHSPVNCLGQPEIKHNFTAEEKQNITDDMALKIRRFAVTLRERINSQCLINKEHDKLHN